MNYTDFFALIKQPETVMSEQIPDLRELVEQYPYFVPARMLLAKLLQQTGSIHYGAQFQLACLYTSNPRWLYYYINPDRKLSTHAYRPEKTEKSGGDYFDMMTVVESGGGDTKATLKNLAERLKSARSLVTGVPDKSTTKPVKVSIPIQVELPEEPKIIDVPIKSTVISRKSFEVSDYFGTDFIDVSEYQAKKLIAERKYPQAIEILKQLNLNNPKKSVYFADQIRFLEKVIVNSKK